MATQETGTAWLLPEVIKGSIAEATALHNGSYMIICRQRTLCRLARVARFGRPR